MTLCKASKILEYLVSLTLLAFFVYKVTNSYQTYQEYKIGNAVETVRHRYVKFPSVSVCLYDKRNRSSSGFNEVRPLNETFVSLDYVVHFKNGYEHLMKSEKRLVSHTFSFVGLILKELYPRMTLRQIAP